MLVAGIRLASADNSVTAPDGTQPAQPDVGLYTSMVLDSSGNPVIAYFDNTNGNLKIMHCNDPNCAGGNESKTVAGSPGTNRMGVNPSLALDHLGYPVVSYYDETADDLKLLHCNDPNCLGNNESLETPASVGDVGRYSSLFIDDIHHPKIAYIDGTGIVRVMSCNDDNCAGGNETITTVGAEAEYVSIVPDGSGFPVIAWRNVNPIFDTLWIIHCDDFDCTSHSDETPDPGFQTGYTPSLQLDNFGNPVVSYRAIPFADIKVLHCNDPDCDGAGDTVNAPVGTGSTGFHSSLEMDDTGNPVISYYNLSTRTLDILHCNDPNCAIGGDSVTSPDPVQDERGQYTSLELDDAGNPVVSYYSSPTQGNLKVLHCDNPDCDPPATATPTDAPTATPTVPPTPTPPGPTPSPTAPGPTPTGATPTTTATGETPTPTPTPTPTGQTSTPTNTGPTRTPRPSGQSPTPTPTATPVGQTPTPTGQTPTPDGETPTPIQSSPPLGLVWGDVDCDHLVNPVDALKGLRFDAALSVSQGDGCPEPGGVIGGKLWGDWDCSAAIDPVDALKDLRHDAGLDVPQNEPCPEIGEGT